MSINKTTLLLVLLITFFFGILISLNATLINAHIDESIHKFTSDGSIYYQAYMSLYEYAELLETPVLFLVGSPILFLKIAEGQLLYVQIFNLMVMTVSLIIARNSFNTFSARISFLIPALLFPYFLFGFLGLNKEIYAMSSAIVYGSYMIRGYKRHLILALILAACARYYMLIAMIVLLFVVPRDREPRYWLAVALLLVFSLAAPIAKYSIPEYSAETLVEDYGGTIGNIFFWTIDHFGYIFIYPIKYVFLMLTRAYALVVGASDDFLGGAVSIFSIIIFIIAMRLFLKTSPRNLITTRLLTAGLLAPIPIMWSEIMHWRYYSFVYYFFLYAIVHHKDINLKSNSNKITS